jgi:hypothetical protein
MKWTLSELGSELSTGNVEWSRSPMNVDLHETEAPPPTTDADRGRLARKSLARRLTLELRAVFAPDSGIAMMDSSALEHGVYRALTALANNPAAAAQLDLFGGPR